MNYKTNTRGLPVRLLGVASLLSLALGAMVAHAEPVTTQQILDRVYFFTTGEVVNVLAPDQQQPVPPQTVLEHLHPLGLTSSSDAFNTCKLTAASGLYCLDGSTIDRWPSPEVPSTKWTNGMCSSSALGLDRSGSCTGITVDLNSDMWVAVKKKNGHSLYKVKEVAAGASCPSPASGTNPWIDVGTWAGSPAPQVKLCAREYFSGRPPLIDITPISEEAQFEPRTGYGPQAGILGLEERKNLVFFPDIFGAAVVPLVSGKEWGLTGKEVLQDATLLQVGGVSYVIAITSNGRILAKNPTSTAPVFRIYTAPAPATAGCPAGEQQYGLRVSAARPDVVYVSDRNACQVRALLADSSGNLTQASLEDGTPLVWTTHDTTWLPPIGLTVAPGDSVALDTCYAPWDPNDTKLGCAVTRNAGLRLFGMTLTDGSKPGATVFQITGILDCRYVNDDDFPQDRKDECDPGWVFNWAAPGVPGSALTTFDCTPPASCPRPSSQWLNVEPQLPADVHKAFEAVHHTSLPELLMSPQYRAQRQNNFTFSALFVLTDPNIQYTSLFTGEYKVEDLEGVDKTDILGCTKPQVTTPVETLLQWDIGTDISEVYKGTHGIHVDMLSNYDCNSYVGAGGRLSLLPYNLEVTPDTYGVTAKLGNPVEFTADNDAVFARLLQKLYGDLGYALDNQACMQADKPLPPGALLPVDYRYTPLSQSSCITLKSTWDTGRQFIDKCIAASFDPKSSSSNENCKSFVAQVNKFQSSIPAAAQDLDWDIANRVNELKARVLTIQHVYQYRFIPSIPPGGFCKEKGTCP